ncbi:hypothetical protein F2Q69_00044850 [Brassica cretica]|uniref:Uncharacterized protein n=1 Tax=Brassica cretica TaxID=69181 RepID=A0A8S9NLG0_BRACR|nr:hypothetical protein F2Q69_00044850 [Brassica cretica]
MSDAISVQWRLCRDNLKVESLGPPAVTLLSPAPTLTVLSSLRTLIPRPTLSLPSAPKTLLTARTLNTRRTLTLPFASRPSGLTTLSLSSKLREPSSPSYQIESQATAGSPRRSDSNFSHSNSSRLSDTDSPRRLPFLGSGGVSTPAGDDEEVLGDPLLGAEAAVLADAKAWAKFLEVSNSFIQWMISTLKSSSRSLNFWL